MNVDTDAAIIEDDLLQEHFENGLEKDAINEGNLILLNGFGCCNTSLYLEFAKCFGFSAKLECLCCLQECCCKYDAPWLACCCDFGLADMCFHFGLMCCQCALKHPNVCCKCQSHVCCIVNSISIPPDDGSAFYCGMLFCRNISKTCMLQNVGRS